MSFESVLHHRLRYLGKLEKAVGEMPVARDNTQLGRIVSEMLELLPRIRARADQYRAKGKYYEASDLVYFSYATIDSALNGNIYRANMDRVTVKTILKKEKP